MAKKKLIVRFAVGIKLKIKLQIGIGAFELILHQHRVRVTCRSGCFGAELTMSTSEMGPMLRTTMSTSTTAGGPGDKFRHV
jgi:hypothetical protein